MLPTERLFHAVPTDKIADELPGGGKAGDANSLSANGSPLGQERCDQVIAAPFDSLVDGMIVRTAPLTKTT